MVAPEKGKVVSKGLHLSTFNADGLHYNQMKGDFFKDDISKIWILTIYHIRSYAIFIISEQIYLYSRDMQKLETLLLITFTIFQSTNL